MSLTSRTVRIIVILIVISLTGLVALQAWLLLSAMELREAAFNRHVMTALASAVQDLEESETAEMAWTMVDSAGDGKNISVITVIADDGRGDSSRDEIVAIEGICPDPQLRMDSGRLTYTIPDSQHVKIRLFSKSSSVDSVLLDSLMEGGQHHIDIDHENLDNARLVIDYESDDGIHALRATAAGLQGMLSGDSLKFAFVRNIVDRLIIGETRSLGERINSDYLDSLLRHRLAEADITLDYAFGVTDDDGDSLWLARPDEERAGLIGSPLRTNIFPHDLVASEAELILLFPDQTLYMWRQAGLLLPATALFVIIIVLCFAYTLRAIALQRRSAALMVGFVNNMTHEFKTPISTIALACEAILRPDVIRDPTRVTEFSEMIQSENRRMRRQTEKILQMAALEEKDYELALTQVDVHEILEQAVRNFSVQIEHRCGAIAWRPEATRSTVLADKVHLAAIIHNLLDNACKYSPGKPQITVATRNDVRGVYISVADQGQGIPLEDQKRVFEKYYRVSSGDVHDVKGFGLGLSYVDLMVRAHGGSVSLDSAPWKGTRVEVLLPFDGREE